MKTRKDKEGTTWEITLYYEKFAPYSWCGHPEGDGAVMTCWDSEGVNRDARKWDLTEGFEPEVLS